jgi:transcriptional regulator with XRE-family HTH domain
MAKRRVKNTDEKRTPMLTDFGEYLRSVRMLKGITRPQLAESLGLSKNTIRNIEEGINSPPNPQRLKVWLSALGEAHRYNEAMKILRQLKLRRVIHFLPRDPANEHIDRLIDSYENGRLSLADLRLLQMISPQEYTDG